VTRDSFVTALQLSIRAALAAAISLAIGQALTRGLPVAILIAAVIVTDLSPVETRRRAGRRMVGSVLGAAIGAVVGLVCPPAPYAIGVGVFVAMLATQLLRLEGATALAGYVAGIVVLSSAGAAWTYAMFRVFDTGLGIGVAVLVSYVPKLLRINARAE
jgi:uncharacterized membrane protein YgaE (UPF0421/DUF939 family)